MLLGANGMGPHFITEGLNTLFEHTQSPLYVGIGGKKEQGLGEPGEHRDGFPVWKSASYFDKMLKGGAREEEIKMKREMLAPFL